MLRSPRDAKEAVLAWAAQQWPEETLLNLSDVISRVQDAKLKQALQQLSKTLYAQSNPQTQWNGKTLWRSLTHYRAAKPTKKITQPSLPPLNR